MRRYRGSALMVLNTLPLVVVAERVPRVDIQRPVGTLPDRDIAWHWS